MLKKLFLPSILGVLAYGFWISPDFKEISAGVAIFLFGMLALEEGFRFFTGGVLEKFLKKCTNKTWKSLSFGVVSTTLMQSSSLVSVLTISFLSAELITLAQGIGIIFGANIGTTTGAWLVAGLGLKVKISAYAMPMLIFGVVFILQKSKTLKGWGYVLAGMGFLFLGIHHMKEGFEAFKASIDLAAYAVTGLPGLFLFMAIGILATVVMQSSHATLVLIITALAAQQITYENALALAIGANVGTTITAIIGAMSSNIAGKRLAGAHLIFNIVTGVVAILFLSTVFLPGVEWFSGIFKIASDNYAIKLAIFHTLFNVAGVVIMVPFISILVRFLEKRLKGEKEEVSRLKYLNESVTEFPETLEKSTRKEFLRLWSKTFVLISKGISVNPDDIKTGDDPKKIVERNAKVVEFDIDKYYQRDIKALHSKIIKFLAFNQESFNSSSLEKIYQFRVSGRALVSAIKDIKHLHKNLFKYMSTDNKYIKNEYFKIRVEVVSLLQSLWLLEKQIVNHNHPLENFNFDEIRAKITNQETEINTSLDKLIREKLIAGHMATSVLNDKAYSWSVLFSLISMAELLFLKETKDYKNINQ